MPTTIKMRCNRLSQFDSNGQNLREAQLTAMDEVGQPLNAANVITSGSASLIFVAPNGESIQHGAVLDIIISDPAAAMDAATPTE